MTEPRTRLRHSLAPMLAPLLALALAGCQHGQLHQTEASLVAANQQAGHA